MAAFSHTIAPTRVTAPYRLGLVIVAFAMLLLPAIYLALTAATLWFTYWYVTTVWPWLPKRFGFSVATMVLYLAPPFAGVAMGFFLVKPILARRIHRPAPVVVDRNEAPDLFALIEAICAQVRAPIPQRVQVDCVANASASFLPGPLSFWRRRLVLTVGLPLVGSLSVRQLAGVLAHEFGHFAQGAAMRLTWVIRNINFWFFRVVYERDRWDAALEAWGTESRSSLSLVVLTGHVCILASRRVLAALLHAGHVISCVLMQQMEFDADSYEIKLAGSDAFARTMSQLRALNAGTVAAFHEISEAHVLPANLPQFVIAKTMRLPAHTLAELRRPPEEPTRRLDTHPSDRDRLRAAAVAEDAGALVGGDEPARSLFVDFDALSATATKFHYVHNWRVHIDSRDLAQSNDLMREGEQRRARASAVKQFFDGRLSVRRPLRVPLPEVEGQPASVLAAMRDEAATAMRAADARSSKAHTRFEWLAIRADKSFCAEEALRAGLSNLDPDQFDLATSTLQDAQDTQKWAHDEQQALTGALDGFDRAASTRLACTLALATRDDDRIEIRQLVHGFNVVSRTLPFAFEIARYAAAQNAIRGPRPVPSPTSAMSARLDLLNSKLTASVAGMYAALGDVRHPLPDGGPPPTLAEWCGFSSNVLIVEPSLAVERIISVYQVILGSLAVIACRLDAAGSADQHVAML
jgi:Zn-dependent protease with chaperone function